MNRRRILAASSILCVVFCLLVQTPLPALGAGVKVLRQNALDRHRVAGACVAGPIARYTMDDKGMKLLKSSEGKVNHCYTDAVGVKTVGYGHACQAAGDPACHCKGTYTEKEIDDILRRDLKKFEDCIKRNIKVPLNTNEFSALVSFSFNVGCGAFQSSSLKRDLNAGHRDKVQADLDKWVKGNKGPLPGLVTRRKNEGRLFFDKDCSGARVAANAASAPAATKPGTGGTPAPPAPRAPPAARAPNH